MRHLLKHPAFPDIVGEWAAEAIDRKAHVWTVTRGADGGLEEQLDPAIQEIVDALVVAAAEQDIAANRVW